MKTIYKNLGEIRGRGGGGELGVGTYWHDTPVSKHYGIVYFYQKIDF